MPLTNGQPVFLSANYIWDSNGPTGGPVDGGGAWLATGKWWDGLFNRDWTSTYNASFGLGGAGGAVTLASPTVVNSMTFNLFSGTYTIGTAGQTITLNAGIAKNSNSSGITTFISPITLASPQTFFNHSTAELGVKGGVNLNGNLLTIDGTGFTSFGATASIITGAGGITKNGTGLCVLGAGGTVPVHNFSGTFTINGGEVRFNGNLSANCNLVISEGVYSAYWVDTFTRTLGTGAGQVQILGGSSGFSENGSTGMTVKLNNNSAYEVVWGSTHFNPTIFILQSATAQGASAILFDNKLDLNGANRTIFSSITTGTGTGYARMGQVIRNSTGTAGIIKEGSGTLELGAANTYNGDTVINNGILRLAAGGSIAGNVITNGPGKLCGPATNNNTTVTGTVTIADDSTGGFCVGDYGSNTMNTGALTFLGTNSRLNISSRATTMNKVNVTGNVALGGCGITFPAGITTNGTYDIIVASGTMSGLLPTIITNATGKTLVLSQVGNTLKVTVS
jgi:autotransporter-associated beta strand protein